MTGAEHYREAERLLDRAAGVPTTGEDYQGDEPAAAQVHAILALAAATAYPAVCAWTGDDDPLAREVQREWTGVAS